MNKLENYISSLPSLKGKTIIVTGANSGIGLEVTKLCLQKGADVVLACRNVFKALDCKNNLQNIYKDSKIDILIYDQSSIESCKKFADDIFDLYPYFYGLVLNAGLFNAKKGEVNKDGYPVVSGTNAIGLLAILNKIDDELKKTTREKRIIIQGSLAAFLSKYKDVEKSIKNPCKNHFYQYNISKKLAVNYFDFYAKNNENPYVKFLLAEPGICATNIIRNYPKWFKPIAKGFMKIFCQPPMEGAFPVMHLLTNIVSNGDYYKPKHIFGYRGFPKKGKINKKHLINEMPNLLDLVK